MHGARQTHEKQEQTIIYVFLAKSNIRRWRDRTAKRAAIRETRDARRGQRENEGSMKTTTYVRCDTDNLVESVKLADFKLLLPGTASTGM